MALGGEDQFYQDNAFKVNDQQLIMEESDSIESSLESSSSSILSSISSDMTEDASSSSSSSSSLSTHGPLCELSELIDQIPIKRGLSKYYQGKSQSFASLACAKSLEDLASRGRRTKMKTCKSYGGGLDKQIHSPKATISKKPSTSSRVSLNRRPSNIPVRIKKL